MAIASEGSESERVRRGSESARTAKLGSPKKEWEKWGVFFGGIGTGGEGGLQHLSLSVNGFLYGLGLDKKL